MANQYTSRYTGTQIDDAVGQAHEHDNKEVLDSISQESIKQWGKSGRPEIYLSADLSSEYSLVTCIVFSDEEPTEKKFSDLIDEAGSIDNLIYNYDFFYGDPRASQTKYTLDIMYSSDAGSLMFTSSIDSREHGCKYIKITYNEVTGDLNASYSYLNSASKTSKGIMQVGDYLTENNGVVSVDVKQTYSSSSSNPLSGVAVAQAISESIPEKIVFTQGTLIDIDSLLRYYNEDIDFYYYYQPRGEVATEDDESAKIPLTSFIRIYQKDEETEGTIKLTGDNAAYNITIIGECSCKSGEESRLIEWTIKNHTSQNIVDGNATGSIKMINAATASGSNSAAFGSSTQAKGESSFAEGTFSTDNQPTIASGRGSHAEGIGTIASGSGAHSEGGLTKASGDQSHAEGYYTEATSKFAHSEGIRTSATSSAAHAEGADAVASEECAHAEGRFTSAHGKYSHAQGYKSKALGNYSDASGLFTISTGAFSSVRGTRNIKDTTLTSRASGTEFDISKATAYNSETKYAKNAIVFDEEGRYYISKTSNNSGSLTNTAYWTAARDFRGKYLEIVGNGIDDDNPSNAYTLDWEGNGWFRGTVKVGGTSQDDLESKELATKEYVDSKTEILSYETVFTDEDVNKLKTESASYAFRDDTVTGKITLIPLVYNINYVTDGSGNVESIVFSGINPDENTVLTGTCNISSDTFNEYIITWITSRLHPENYTICLDTTVNITEPDSPTTLEGESTNEELTPRASSYVITIKKNGLEISVSDFLNTFSTQSIVSLQHDTYGYYPLKHIAYIPNMSATIYFDFIQADNTFKVLKLYSTYSSSENSWSDFTITLI